MRNEILLHVCAVDPVVRTSELFKVSFVLGRIVEMTRSCLSYLELGLGAMHLLIVANYKLRLCLL